MQILFIYKTHLILDYFWRSNIGHHKFNYYIDVLYRKELEIKNTTDAPKWANYIDRRLEFYKDGKLYTRLYDKCDDFDFPTNNFPYLSSNIPESPAYGVFVSQLICYARVCSKYEDFLFRGSILVSKLLKQGYSSQKLLCSGLLEIWNCYARVC